MSQQSFADLGVSRAVAGALAERGITEPFAIQQLVIADVLAGHDVLTKSFGTTNSHNITKATVDGLRNLRRASDVAQMRGMTVQELLGVRPRRTEDVAQA